MSQTSGSILGMLHPLTNIYQHKVVPSTARLQDLESNTAKRGRFENWNDSPESSQSSHSEDVPIPLLKPIAVKPASTVPSSASSDEGVHTEDERPSSSGADLLTIGEYDKNSDSGNSSAPTPDSGAEHCRQPCLQRPLLLDAHDPGVIHAEAKFFSFTEFEEAFELWKNIYHHPFRVASSETLKEPDGTVNNVFKYRYIVYHCAHYGQPRMRGVGKRPNQNYLPCGCKAMLRLNYNFNEKLLKVTTLNDCHNGHELNAESYANITKKIRKSPGSSAEPSPNLKRRRTEYKYEQKLEPATVPLAVRHGNTNGMQGGGGQHDMSGWAQHQMNMNPQFAALMAHQQRMTAVLMAQKENMPSPQSHPNQSPSINNSITPINNHSATPPQLAGLPRPQPQLPTAHLPQGMLLNFLMHQQRLMSMANTPNHGLVAPVMHPAAEPTPAATGKENGDGQELDVESSSEQQSPDHFSNELPLTPQRAAANEVEAATPIAAATPQSAATATYPAATASPPPTLTTLQPVTFTPMATVKQELQKLGFVPQHELQKVAAMQQNVAAMQQNVAAMHQMPSTPGDVVRKLLDNLESTLIEADPVAREQRIAHIANVVRIWNS